MKSTLVTSIHHSLTMSAPAPQELYMEISRLRYAPSRVHPPEVGITRIPMMMNNMGMSMHMNMGMDGGIQTVAEETWSTTEAGKKRGEASASASQDEGDVVQPMSFESFRLRYVLEGLQHILQSGALDSSEMR
jgi:hypothetical protein